MVTREAKELLRNTIRHTDFHNRLLEEEDMWKHWEMGRGLTMMVTDDCIRNRIKERNSRHKASHDSKEMSKHKQEARKANGEQSNYWTRKLIEAEEKDPQRWGHSGYKEMYPDEFKSSKVSTESPDGVDSKSRHRKRHKNKRKKHKRHRSSSSSSESHSSKLKRSSSSSSSVRKKSLPKKIRKDIDVPNGSNSKEKTVSHEQKHSLTHKHKRKSKDKDVKSLYTRKQQFDSGDKPTSDTSTESGECSSSSEDLMH